MVETLLNHTFASVIRCTIQPGECTAFESVGYSKLIVCLSGHGVAASDADNVVLKPGANAHILPQALHRIKNTGAEPLVVLETSYGTS